MEIKPPHFAFPDRSISRFSISDGCTDLNNTQNCSQSPCLYMSYEATYALKCSLFKKIVKNQFFALRVHKKQFLANISKTERFSMYVASGHLYKCDHCAHFGVFEKSLRPSGAELAFLPNCAKRAWPP